ncbi:hypothetical protein JQ599_32100 [Bradyrhizobium diazoefficiens]|nr:hypothetical protein [Bradyrhizobium diazoefficiens]MBR0773152.1 hypothetical protein [Bradyrhizobium diazoefficiens]
MWASDFFSVADADGDTITRYQFRDLTTDAESGHFMVDGVQQNAGVTIDITASQLSKTHFQTGSGSDDIQVRAYDGFAWSAFETAHINAPLNNRPAITASNSTFAPGQQVSLSGIFSVSDADGDTMTRYQFWDSTPDPNSGRFVVGGVATASVSLEVTQAELASTAFQSGLGQDQIWVRAHDGYTWSRFQELHVDGWHVI